MNANLETNRNQCGSWLACDGGVSVPEMQSGTPLSQASQLPQGIGASL